MLLTTLSKNLDDLLNISVIDTTEKFNIAFLELGKYPILTFDIETVGITAEPLFADMEMLEKERDSFIEKYGDKLYEDIVVLEETKKYKKDYEAFIKDLYPDQKILMSNFNILPEHRETLSKRRKDYLTCEKQLGYCKDFLQVEKRIAALQKRIEADKSGLNYFTNRLGLIQLGTLNSEDIYKQYLIYPEVIPPGRLGDLLRTRSALIGHNLKFDCLNIAHHLEIIFDDVPTVLYDTLLADKMLRSGLTRSFKLQNLVEHYLEVYQDKDEQISNWLRRPLKPEQIKYGGRDALVPALLYPILKQNIKDENLIDCTKLQMDFLKVLIRMQRVGMYIDLNLVNELIQDLEVDIEKQKKILGERIGDPNLEICKETESPKETLKLLKAYGEKQNNDTLRFLESTSAATFEEIEEIIPILDEVSEFRSLLHTKSNYCQAFTEKNINGRIHSDFVQLQKEGTRGSSKNPNIQNIPQAGHYDRSIFKSIFEAAKTWEPKARLRTVCRPAPGKKLYGADYSAIELCMIAYYSQDHEMVKALIEGTDLHSLTAKSLFNLDIMLDVIKKLHNDKRQVGKTFNFSTVYGAGIMKLLKLLWKSGIFSYTFEEIRELKYAWYRTYAGIKSWQDQHLKEVQSNGFCTTRLGRKIYFEDAQNVYSKAFNTPIQASCYEGLQRAAVLFNQRVVCLEITGKIPVGSIELVNLIHDEFLVEADENLPEEKVKNLIETCMVEGMQPLMEYAETDTKVFQKIPVNVECKVLSCWAEKG